MITTKKAYFLGGISFLVLATVFTFGAANISRGPGLAICVIGGILATFLSFVLILKASMTASRRINRRGAVMLIVDLIFWQF